MRDFIYQSPVKMLFGEDQLNNVVEETKRYGKKVLLVFGGNSFRKNGHHKHLVTALEEADMEIYEMDGVKSPLLSKVREGIDFCKENDIEVILGIGGGTCMDVAKTIAFGVKQSEDILKYLTGEVSGEGLTCLPVGTIVTYPSSGSDLDAATQITDDETGEQMGLDCVYPSFAWLNPEFMMSLDNQSLVRGQITSFVHLSLAYLGLERSQVSEDIAVTMMKSIIKNLHNSIHDSEDKASRANLMLLSSLAINGITSMGKIGDWSMYPMQGIMQSACKVPYTISIGVFFPYWLKNVSGNHDIFKNYFENVFDITCDDKENNTIIEEGINKIFDLYREFEYPTCFSEASTSIDEKFIKSCTEMLASMPSIYTDWTSEKVERMLFEAIQGINN